MVKCIFTHLYRFLLCMHSVMCTFVSGGGGGGSASCRSGGSGLMILSCRSVVRCDETGITLVFLFGFFWFDFHHKYTSQLTGWRDPVQVLWWVELIVFIKTRMRRCVFFTVILMLLPCLLVVTLLVICRHDHHHHHYQRRLIPWPRPFPYWRWVNTLTFVCRGMLPPHPFPDEFQST